MTQGQSATTTPNLLPMPRRLAMLPGANPLTPGRFIALNEGLADRADVLRAGRIMQEALAELGARWELTTALGTSAVLGTSAGLIGLALHVDPAQAPWREGYRLSILPGQIQIVAHDEAGAFYAAQTLRQIVRSLSFDQAAGSARELPCLRIEDWPDFANRGVMLDISRDKVPTLETIKGLVDLLAGWKINQVQLYTEHTYAYRNHRKVWEDASPMTGEEILDLDAFCRERHIELVPNQNSFGHFHHWLEHEPYRALAEVPETPWGINPTAPGAIELLGEMFAELLPHFTSRQFNVGCDETFDLGKGRSKEAVEAKGEGRVYLDFLLQIHRLVQGEGRTMQFWGDIIMNHPELIPELPEGIIALEWGYEADQPPAGHCARFQAAGVPYYVCPGTSSWNSLTGRTKNAVGNLWRAAENGLAHGAIGYLITDWGDHGHWQTLPVSYLGFAYGAAVSWAAQANREIDLPGALDRHAFGDRAGVMGQLVYDLGNNYLETGVETANSTVPWWMLVAPKQPVNEGWMAQVKPERLTAAVDGLERLKARLGETRMDRPDAALIVEELRNNATLAQHACRQGLARLSVAGGEYAGLAEATRRALAEELATIIAEHRRLWLARNREGGLTDSVSMLEEPLRAYRLE